MGIAALFVMTAMLQEYLLVIHSENERIYPCNCTKTLEIPDTEKIAKSNVQPLKSKRNVSDRLLPSLMFNHSGLKEPCQVDYYQVLCSTPQV